MYPSAFTHSLQTFLDESSGSIKQVLQEDGHTPGF